MTARPPDATPTRWSWVPALAIGAGLFALLSWFVGADPATGVTLSASPWSDEAWNALGARNFIELGHWSTDQWNLYLVEVPFNLGLAPVFGLFGIGIVQARLFCILAVVLAIVGIGIGLRRPFGTLAAALAALALATTTLILYYGRLVYLEDLVVLALVAAALTLVPSDVHPGRWGLVAGGALAVAVGTKPNAILAAGGLVVGIAAFGIIAERRLLRWVGGAVAALVVAAIAWWLVVYLPHEAAIADDLRIISPFRIPATLAELRAQLVHLPRSDGLWRNTWPLLTAGTIGALVAVSRPEGRTGIRGALLFGALGWLALGGSGFALVTYQPNRYFVPLLPAFAILMACGLGVAWPWLRAHVWPAIRIGVASGAAIALATPGLLGFTSWMARATYWLPTMQEQVRSLVPSGATAFGGYAPAMLMRAPVVTIARTVGDQTNADLYVTRGVRWLVIPRGTTVEPIARAHPAAWAARAAVYCAPWRGGDLCLYHLP